MEKDVNSWERSRNIKAEAKIDADESGYKPTYIYSRVSDWSYGDSNMSGNTESHTQVRFQFQIFLEHIHICM